MFESIIVFSNHEINSFNGFKKLWPADEQGLETGVSESAESRATRI